MNRKFTFLAMCVVFFTTLRLSAQAPVFTDTYAAGVTFSAFGGSTNDVTIDNTVFQSGTASLKIAVPAAGYTGGALAAATPQSLVAYNAVTFWIKGSAAKTLNVAGLGNNATTTVFQTELVNIPVTTTWTKVIIPIPVAAKLTLESGLFHFAEGADEGAYTIWLDNIQYETLAAGVIGTPTAAMATETINKTIGDSFSPNGLTCSFPVNSVATVLSPSKAYFTYASSNAAVATVSALGEGKALAAGTTDITAMLGSVAVSGTLTVKVSAVTAPTVAAPAPTKVAANVISLFSNAYTNKPVDTWSASWDQADVADVKVAGDDNKLYTNLTYAGIEFVGANMINAKDMTHFHIDIWTPNSTTFKVKLVDFGANGAYQGTPNDDTEHELSFTPELGKWVSYNIPFTDFTGLKAREHLAQMIFVGSTSTVYVDNVYFYKDGAAPNVPTAAAPTPTKPAADVISLFSNAYTNKPVDTWSADWDQADVADVKIADNDNKLYTNLNFAGIEFTGAKMVNAKDMTHFHVDIWTPNATTFKVKLVDFGANGAYQGTPNDDTEHELAFTPELGKWVSYDIPFTDFTGLKAREHLAQMILVSSASTVYVDNVYFYKVVVAPTVPTAAAPTPTKPAADVISLFSNAYTNKPVDTWSADWDQADVADVKIADNDNKLYTNLNFAGIEFTGAKMVNAKDMTHFHVDIWTPNATTFKVKLVDFGANGAYQGTPNDDTEHELAFTPELGKWVSYDIPFTDFTGLKAREHLAQMILVSSASTVYVDNVYFYKVVVAPTAPTVAAPTPTKPAANVISLFSNAYTNKPVDTWSADWDQADVADVKIANNDNKLYTKLTFAGIEFVGANMVNAKNMTHFHMDIWTPNSTTFKIKLVDFGANGTYQGTPNDDTEHELAFTPELGKWVSYDIPFTDFTGLKAKEHLAQMILVGSNSTVYVDNVYFYNNTSVGTQDVNFTNNIFKVAPSVSDVSFTVDLNLDAANEGVKSLSMVNIFGQSVVQKTLAKNVEQHIISTQNLSNGIYFVTMQVGKRIQTQKVVVSH